MSPEPEGTCTVSENVPSGLTVSILIAKPGNKTVLFTDPYVLCISELFSNGPWCKKIYQFCTFWSGIYLLLNTLRPRQDGRHFPDDIFKCIFFNENVWISIKISLKFVPKGPINNIPSLVQIMAWRRPGDKPLSEPMMVSLLTHICITRPQWVNALASERFQFNCR